MIEGRLSGEGMGMGMGTEEQRLRFRQRHIPPPIGLVPVASCHAEAEGNVPEGGRTHTARAVSFGFGFELGRGFFRIQRAS